MAFEFVFLKTDTLLFVLVATALIYAVIALRTEHLRAPWREVARRPLGMSAAVVLSVFLGTALLDSIHLRWAGDEGEPAPPVFQKADLVSILDLLVAPLKLNVEKTYSAPFAAYGFSRETVILGDGATERRFPRLEYGGSHLQEPAAERGSDLARRAAMGLVLGLLWSGAFVMASVFLQARRRSKRWVAVWSALLHGRDERSWRAVLITFSALVVIVCELYQLAPVYHVLGTDKTGNDVLYQAIKSVRTGLLIGTLTTLVMLPFAILLGIAAGYFRGWIDDLIQYLYTTLSSVPGVLLIAAAALMLEVYMSRHGDSYASLAARADLRLLALCMILGVTTWTGLCRYLRGEALKLREIDFIAAAKAFGVPRWAILLRHIMPNVMHIVMISIVLDFSGLVLAEAALTYIDIGVDPSMESWGNMINSARLELAREPVVWWSLLAAFLFMFTLVLAANVFADAVRDAFDPRVRGES